MFGLFYSIFRNSTFFRCFCMPYTCPPSFSRSQELPSLWWGRVEETIWWFSRGWFDCVGEREAARFWEDVGRDGAWLQDVRRLSRHWRSASWLGGSTDHESRPSRLIDLLNIIGDQPHSPLGWRCHSQALAGVHSQTPSWLPLNFLSGTTWHLYSIPHSFSTSLLSKSKHFFLS